MPIQLYLKHHHFHSLPINFGIRVRYRFGKKGIPVKNRYQNFKNQLSHCLIVIKVSYDPSKKENLWYNIPFGRDTSGVIL